MSSTVISAITLSSIMELARAFHTLVTADGLSSWNGVYALKEIGLEHLLCCVFTIYTKIIY